MLRDHGPLDPGILPAALPLLCASAGMLPQPGGTPGYALERAGLCRLSRPRTGAPGASFSLSVVRRKADHAQPRRTDRNGLPLAVCMQLPSRDASIQVTDCSTGHRVGLADFRGHSLGGVVALPMTIFAPDRPLFAKLRRRHWFFDKAGWMEIQSHRSGGNQPYSRSSGPLPRPDAGSGKTSQLARKNSITSLLFACRPFGTSCLRMARSCCCTLRNLVDEATSYLFTPRRSRQPLIQISSMKKAARGASE